MKTAANCFIGRRELGNVRLYMISVLFVSTNELISTKPQGVVVQMINACE